ncbi:MAG TPA: GH25 family lysozyme, partial [Bacteroidia bacterium]|nr:GH25 family lysozyme [Bacteroidia bacterium]
TTNSWITVSAYMNAGNWTLFNVTSGNVYEWSYCEAYGGVSTNWDPQLTLINNTSGANLCFSDNNCGTTGKGPYISWTATYTGVVKLLTSQSNCVSNTGSPYATLVWRQANGGVSTTILGVDVSHYDGTITWSQVKAMPKLFAWAKATEGTTIADAQYTANEINGTAAGVAMGAYHFAHPETNTAASEASYFLSVASTYIKPCYLPPALDLEDPPSGPALTTAMTSAALTTWVQDWMTAVKTQTGITPVLYTSGSIASYLGSSVNTYPLWIADPDGSSSAPPANIGVWTNWAFKQYSWTGAVNGITGQVDLNVFNGDMTAFNTLIGCATGIAETGNPGKLNLYPNPANDHITLENPEFRTGQMQTVSIYSMQGQLVFQQVQQEATSQIDISAFAKGMYVLVLSSADRVTVKKFIRE